MLFCHRLQLLNSTVSQLAAAVNRVLSKTYSAIYPDLSDSDGVVELKLRTAPLAASEEVTALYTAGLIDIETAVPASMHALGSSSEEIDTTLSRLRAKDAKACACEDEDRELQKKEREAQLEKTKVEIKNTAERGESEPSKD